MRNRIIESLQNLPGEEKIQIEQLLYQHLYKSNGWKESNCIGITISRGFEWDTKPIIEEAWNQGKEIAVPKCSPKEKKLEFYRFKDYNELETVYYNLLEPKPIETNRVSMKQIDLLLVPGIVFNKQGYRIGFGGGYYDRLLTTYNGLTVSLLSRMQLLEELPLEPHDIPVKQLITESGIVT